MDKLPFDVRTWRELREKGYTDAQIQAAAHQANELLEEPRRSLTAPSHQHVVVRGLKGLAAIPAGMAGAATRMLDYMDPNRTPSPEEVNQTRGMVDALKAKTAERSALPLGEAFQRNLSDFTTGATQAFSDQFLSDRPGLAQVASQAYETGKTAPAAIATQMVETIRNPQAYPVDFAMNVLPFVGSARSGLAAGSAALASKGGALGTLGKVGSAVARGTDVAQGITTLAEQTGVVPGAEKMFARMQKLVDDGVLSPEVAGKAMDELHPLHKIAAYHNVPQLPRGLQAAGNVAKGAAVGGLLGGDTGALAGAGLAGGVEVLGALKPGVTAAARRLFVDPYASKTPEETARVASIIDPMYQQESAMRDVAAEVGQEYKAGRVDWHPNLQSSDQQIREAAKAPVPAGIRERGYVTPEGKIQPIPAALDKRSEIAEKALELEHESSLYRGLAKQVEDAADMTDSRWQMLQHTTQGLAQKYSWLSQNIPEVSRNAFNAKMKSIMQSLNDAMVARNKYTVANSLREYADMADAYVNSVRRGAPHEPNVEMAKALEASRVEAGLATKQAQMQATLDPEALREAKLNEQIAKRVPDEKVPAGHDAATDYQRGLDIASGVRKPTSAFRVPAKTNNPRVEAAIDRLHEIGNSTLEPADQIPRHFYARTMTDSLRKTGLSLLQDPQTRGYVVEHLIRELKIPKKAQKTFRTELQERINEYTSNYFGPVENENKSLVLQMADGKERDLSRIVMDALPEDARAQAQQNAVERVGLQLGKQASEKHLIAEIKRELHGYQEPLVGTGKLPRASSVEEYTANMAERVLQGSNIPLVTPYAPKDVAAVLERMAQNASITDAKKLRGIGTRLLEQTPASGEFQKLLADNGIRGIHVSPAFAETVEAKLYANSVLGQTVELQDALTSMTKAGQYLSRRSKIGQTVLSAKNAIHNFVSNAIETSMYDGRDPMTAALAASTDALQRAKFSKTGNGPDARMWRGISRGGLSGLAGIDSEIGTLAGQRRGAVRADVGVGEATIGTLRAAENLARSVHSQTGDMMWKTSAAKRAYQGFADSLAKLKQGEYLGIPMPHDALAVLTKTANGYEGLGKTFAADSQELADLLGTAAVNSAQKLYFHGERQPLLLQKIKHAPLISAASPFVNYMYNAMELPFKPGILSRVLQNGLNVAVSNSPTVHMANAAKFAALAARRMALTSALRQYVDPALDPLRRVAAYKPANPAAGILPGAGPDELNVVAGQSMDPLAPTELLLAGGLRLFQAIGGEVPTKKELASADPQTRARVDFWERMQSAVDFNADDARELGLIAGGPLFHLVMDDKRPVSQRATWAIASLLGGTVTDAARFALEPSPLAPSQQVPHRIDPTEHFLKTVFDYGARPVLATGDKGRITRHIELIAKGLHESLDKQPKLDLEKARLAQRADSAAEGAKHAQEIVQAQAKIDQAARIIELSKRQALKRANAALKHVGKPEMQMPVEQDQPQVAPEEKESTQEERHD